MPSFWESAAQSIPFIGNIAGSAIERGQSRGAIKRQNEYNLPKNQVQRTREAGLPYAALTNAISGNQSNVQESGSGIAEGIQSYVHTTQQKKAIELMDTQMNMIRQQTETEKAQTRKVWADALMSDTAARVATDRAQYNLNKLPLSPISPIDNNYSMQNYQQQREQNISQAELDVKRLDVEIRAIDLRVKDELDKDGVLSNLSRQQLSNLVSQSSLIKAQTKLAGQQHQVTEMQRKVEQTLIESLEGADGKMDVGRAFIHALLSGSLGANRITGK